MKLTNMQHKHIVNECLVDFLENVRPQSNLQCGDRSCYRCHCIYRADNFHLESRDHHSNREHIYGTEGWERQNKRLNKWIYSICSEFQHHYLLLVD